MCWRMPTCKFCLSISYLLQGSFARETYNFKEPANRSPPLVARKHLRMPTCKFCLRILTRPPMGWLQLVGSIKLYVSFAKEPYKRDDILQKRPIILSILLIAATPYSQETQQCSTPPFSKVTSVFWEKKIASAQVCAQFAICVYMYKYTYTHTHIYIYINSQFCAHFTDPLCLCGPFITVDGIVNVTIQSCTILLYSHIQNE